MYAICIRNTNQEGQLTIGKRYKIIQRGKAHTSVPQTRGCDPHWDRPGNGLPRRSAE